MGGFPDTYFSNFSNKKQQQKMWNDEFIVSITPQKWRGDILFVVQIPLALASILHTILPGMSVYFELNRYRDNLRSIW